MPIWPEFVDNVKAHYAGDQGYHSSFWHRTYGICSSLLEHRDQLDFSRMPERAERVWTNVFKIGTSNSNPDRPMADLLVNHGPHLSEELNLLSPHVVVFSTGCGYDEYRRRSGLTPVPISPQLATVVGPQAMVGIRGRHSQAQSNIDVDELYRRLMAAHH